MSCLAEGAAEETFCVRSLGEPPSPHVLRCLWCGDSFSVELCDGQGVWRKEGCRRAAAHTSSDAEWMGRAREALAEGAHQVKVTTDESGNKRLGWVWEAGGATGAASTGTPYLARVLPDEVGAATFRLLAAAAAAAAAASLDAATARAGAAATRRELEKAVKAHSEAVAAKAATEQDLYAKFAAVLNSKKERLREQQENLELALRDREAALDRLRQAAEGWTDGDGEREGAFARDATPERGSSPLEDSRMQQTQTQTQTQRPQSRPAPTPQAVKLEQDEDDDDESLARSRKRAKPSSKPRAPKVELSLEQVMQVASQAPGTWGQ